MYDLPVNETDFDSYEWDEKKNADNLFKQLCRRLRMPSMRARLKGPVAPKAESRVGQPTVFQNWVTLSSWFSP